MKLRDDELFIIFRWHISEPDRFGIPIYEKRTFVVRVAQEEVGYQSL